MAAGSLKPWTPSSTSRPKAVVISYVAACFAGMFATLAYLVVRRDWSDIGDAVQLSAKVGLAGGVVVSPIAVPLILAAERYRWKSPFIYLAALPLLFAGGLLFGVACIGVFAENLINVHHVLHPSSLQLLLCVTGVAVGTYWFLRGRFAGSAG